MTINPTLTSLAEHFDVGYALEKPEPETWTVLHENKGSSGGRYVSWVNIQASRSERDGRRTITMDELYRRVGHRLRWGHLFAALHHSLIVGPSTLAAVEECLNILRTELPPEDAGVDHRISTTARFRKILLTAFQADIHDKTLYSNDFVYTFDSHSGWSRST